MPGEICLFLQDCVIPQAPAELHFPKESCLVPPVAAEGKAENMQDAVRAVLQHGYLPEEAQERLHECITVYQLTYTITHCGIATKSGKSVVGNARAF